MSFVVGYYRSEVPGIAVYFRVILKENATRECIWQIKVDVFLINSFSFSFSFKFQRKFFNFFYFCRLQSSYAAQLFPSFFLFFLVNFN